MVYYKWGLIILLVLTMGCATLQTIIEDPDGKIWKIISKKDALVKFKTSEIEGTIDNRGKLGVVESIFGVLMLKTDIELSNKDRGD